MSDEKADDGKAAMTDAECLVYAAAFAKCTAGLLGLNMVEHALAGASAARNAVLALRLVNARIPQPKDDHAALEMARTFFAGGG